MAECEEQVPDQQQEEEEDDTDKPVYKPPAEKSIQEILKTDDDDESLRKYKETLLGKDAEKVFFPADPRKIILKKMSIVVDGREDKEINLEDKGQLKDMSFVVKEGCKYRLMITFNVQREIVPGLKLCNKVSRGPISSKEQYMVGSYGPSADVYQYKSPEEEFPSGMMSRGSYKVASEFVDDDKNVILAWDWKFEIKKEWKD